MPANTPVKLKPKVHDNLLDFYRRCSGNFNSAWNIRERLMAIDRVYMRERDRTEQQLKASAANRSGDPTKFQNIQVPVVFHSVESAVTYQSSVFLTGSPIFGVSASAQYMDVALQMETILDDQAIKGGWAREIQLALRDGYKYNLGVCEVEWARKKIFSPETDLAFSPTQGKPVETYWEGNTIKRIDPYNLIFDVRYKPTELSTRGEFAGYSELMSRTEYARFLNTLDVTMNVKESMESGPTQIGTSFPSDYFIPILNPQALVNQSNTGGVNWMAWAGLETQKHSSPVPLHNYYIVTTFYVRVIPADFGLPSPAQYVPQIWKFVIVNGRFIVYAERQTNAHDMIPLIFMQPTEDGLGYQTKSFAQNSEPFQSVASALVNSAIHSRRRAIADRGLYDPSRVDTKAINDDNPSAKIPVKPAAYGRPLSEAYYQIPYRDEQSAQAMSDMQAMLALNEQITGLNRAQQGQFVKGNKTLHEYQDVMGNANARQQNTSILLEAQFFTPIKEILKLNVLQYQKPTEVFSRVKEQPVAIDPVALRKANLLFKVSDGQLPAAKQMNSEAFTSAAQAIAAMPQLASAYNIGPMFSYLFKGQRADVAQFEKSPQLIQYEQAMAAWQNAAGQLAQTYAKLTKPDGTSYTPEEIQEHLPPQPTMEQFGLDPANPGAPPAKPGGTLLDQVGQIDAAQAQAQGNGSPQ